MEIEEKIKKYYTYNPDTGFKECEIHVPEEEDTPEFDHITSVVPPAYDADAEQIKYDTTESTWEIVPLADPMRNVKGMAKSEIDRSARQFINAHLTSTAQAAGLYDLKYADAIAYTTATKPALSDYLYLKIEVDVTGKKAKACATSIIKKHNEWTSKLVKLELVRRTAKNAIETLSTSSMSGTKFKETVTALQNQAIADIGNI